MAHESRANDAPDWPDVFDEFPLHDDDDDAAAQAWFSAPGNSVFTSWESCVGEKAAHWTGLEHSLQKITGLTGAEVRECGKNAAKEVLANTGLKKHTTTAQKDQIGKLASEHLSKKIACSWKDASMPWVQQACRTLVPRFTHLRKKVARRTDLPKPAPSEQGEAIESPKKRQKLSNESPRAQGRSSPILSQKKPIAKALNSTTPIQQRQQHQFLLCDRDLEVRMEPVAGEMELDTVDNITIAIAAIVYDEALTYQSNDVRPEYLSFDKFYRTLEKTDSNFDWKKNGKILTYDSSKGQTQIEHETSFHVAIGVLAWAANNDGSERKLVMRIEGKANV